MVGRSLVSDKTLLTRITQRLSRAGVGVLNPTVRNGEVTLSGSLKYETQRRSIVSAVAAVEGVRSVVDRLILKPIAKY